MFVIDEAIRQKENGTSFHLKICPFEDLSHPVIPLGLCEGILKPLTVDVLIKINQLSHRKGHRLNW